MVVAVSITMSAILNRMTTINYFYNYRRQKCCEIHPVYLEETVEFNRFFQIDRDKTASAARNLTNFAPQTDATTFAFASVSILLLCH